MIGALWAGACAGAAVGAFEVEGAVLGVCGAVDNWGGGGGCGLEGSCWSGAFCDRETTPLNKNK